MTLSDIRTRLMEVEGASRELDAHIFVTVFPKGGTDDDRIYHKMPTRRNRCAAGTYWQSSRSGQGLRTAPEYTASVHAALQLVERRLPRWNWQICKLGKDRYSSSLNTWNDAKTARGDEKKTPALTILTALLTALIEGESE